MNYLQNIIILKHNQCIPNIKNKKCITNMKNKPVISHMKSKPVISMILSLMFAICLLVNSQAATTSNTNTLDNTSRAETLNALGLFNGTSNGFELSRNTTRIEAAAMLVRLLGKETEAKNRKYLHPFKDVPGWANAGIGYLYVNKLIKGLDATHFGSNLLATPSQYVSFILRALGYDETKGDFSLGSAIRKGIAIGLLTSEEGKLLSSLQTLPRSALVLVTYNSLHMYRRNSEYSLLETLPYQSTQADLKISNLGYIPETPKDYRPYYGYYKTAYGHIPNNVMFAHADGTMSICVNNENNVDVYRVDRSFQVMEHIKIKKIFEKFCGFTCDDKGSYFILFARNNLTEDDKSTNMALRKYDYKGNITGMCDTGGQEFNVMSPLSAATSRLLYADGKIGIHMGRTYYRSPDGLNHQGGLFLCIDAQNMKLLVDESIFQTAGHSFDQRTIYADEGFIKLDLADNYPRGFSLSRNGRSKVIFTYKTQMGTGPSYKGIPAGKWSNDNATYSQLGGLAADANGYVVLGSSEKSLDFSNPKTDSRNLFMVLVDKDFSRIQTDGERNEVSRQVVISKGEDSGIFGFYDFNGGYNKQKRVGVVWLTNYDDADDNNVISPKLAALSNGIYIALWENHSSRGYKSTCYMLFDAYGRILKDVINIGNVRLSPGDDLCVVDGKIVWVSSSISGRQINQLTVDIDGLNIVNESQLGKNENDILASGTISLPNGEIANNEGLRFYIDAVSDNGTPDIHEDDIRKHQIVLIGSGTASAGFSMELPQSMSGYKFGYELLDSSKTSYFKNGYLSASGTSISEKSQSVIDLSKGDPLNMVVIKKHMINGTLSLPFGEVAPKGGLSVSVNTRTDNGTPSDYSDDNDDAVTVNIPEGENSNTFHFPLSPTSSGYVFYTLSQTNGLNYCQIGYYSNAGTVPAWSGLSRIDTTFSEISLTVLKGCTLKGTVSFPSGDVGPEGGYSLIVIAESEKATPYDNTNYRQSIFLTIPEGKNSVNYSMVLFPSKTSYSVYYEKYTTSTGYSPGGSYGANGATLANGKYYIVDPSKDQSIDLVILKE